MSGASTDLARELRCSELHRVLCRRRDARTPTAVRGLGELWCWPSWAIDDALGDLSAAGVLAADEHGRITVKNLRPCGLENGPGDESRAASSTRRINGASLPNQSPVTGSREGGS